MYKFYTAILAIALAIPVGAGAQSNTDGTPFTVASISENQFQAKSSESESKVYDVDVTLTEAGTLSQFVTEAQMWSAKSLRVAGPINGDDVNIIRQMAGLKDYQSETPGIVTDINLADATIVAGGSSYCRYYSMETYSYVDCVTSDNVFPPVFLRRTSIEHLDLPKSITAIAYQALYGCGVLTSVIIPETVTTIETQAFAGSGLTSVKLPAAATSLGNYVFWGCANLTKIDIESPLTSIPEGMVSQSSINEFNIPESATKIGMGAFKDCSNLETVTGGENVNEIGSYAFNNCVSFKNFTIGEKVALIGTEAFCNNWQLGNLTIPAATTFIGYGAFYNCRSMTAYTVADDNPEYKTIDGILYSKDGIDVIDCPSGHMNAVTVADGVETVKESCFGSCVKLQSVTLPASVKTIDCDAFEYCESLTSLTVNAMTPPELGWSDPFYGVDMANCRLYVPEEAVQAYTEAETWKDFFITTGIDEISVDGNAETEWFNLLGNRVNATDLVPGNVYIRRNGTRTAKVIVK